MELITIKGELKMKSKYRLWWTVKSVSKSDVDIKTAKENFIELIKEGYFGPILADIEVWDTDQGVRVK